MKKYVSGLIFNEDGNFLLLRRTRTAPWKPLHWNLPAGLIEAGEEPAAALEREVLEELNLSIPHQEYGARGYFESAACTDYYFSLGVDLLQQMSITLNYEHDAAVWVNPRTMLEYKLIPELDQRIYDMLIAANDEFGLADLHKALADLIGESDPDLDLLVKAGGVVKGTHKRDNPDYEPIRKNGQVVGYKKKGQADPTPTQASKMEERTGVAHPIGTRVAIKSRSGGVVQGTVHKHGDDHKEFGKLIHIKTDDGKQYTRYSHNTHQTTAPPVVEKPTKTDDPESDKAKPATGHLHPVGAKVTVKNRKGERIAGEVIKHGDDHGAKGHLIHVKTDHGTYVRYNHNASRVETGEKHKVELPAEVKPAPAKPVFKPRSKPEQARNDAFKSNEKLYKEAEAGLPALDSDSAQYSLKKLASLSFRESISAIDDARAGLSNLELMIQNRPDSVPNNKVENVQRRKDVITTRRNLAELERLRTQKYDADPNYRALVDGYNKLTEKQHNELNSMSNHAAQAHHSGLEIKEEGNAYRTQGFDKVWPAKYAAILERHRVVTVRTARYNKMIDEFIKSGDLLKALGKPGDDNPSSYTVRKRNFTIADPDNAGAVDYRISAEAKQLIPDQFFSNMNSLANTYTTTGDAAQKGSHAHNDAIHINTSTWGKLSSSTELHEYCHLMHSKLNILRYDSSANCPIAKHIMIDALGKEWNAKPEQQKGQYAKLRIRAGLDSDDLKLAADRYKRVAVTDVIGAISAPKTKGAYGDGHTPEYYIQGGAKRRANGDKISTPHYYQMNEIFCHFADSYFTGNNALQAVFPKTHALAMAYFAKMIVNGNDKH